MTGLGIGIALAFLSAFDCQALPEKAPSPPRVVRFHDGFIHIAADSTVCICKERK